MHRQSLLLLLSNYNPTILEEVIAKEEIIAFITNNIDCFERSLKKGHITASSWLLDYTKEKALLMHHKKLDKWFQLGGHADGDSDVISVAIKEAQEESGIDEIVILNREIFDIDIHLIPANSKDEAHFHYDIRFLLQVPNYQEFKINEEANELRWISKDIKDLPTNEPSIVRMFNKWLQKN